MIRKMKGFLNSLQNSAYSPQFYSSIPKKSFRQSFGYFLLLILVLSVIKLTTLISPLLVEAPLAIQSFISDTINCFPKELEVKIQNGLVTTNVEEPYFIKFCSAKEINQNLVLIDTKTPFSASKFNESSAAAWVTKDSIFYKKSNVETRSYSFIQIKDFKLNRDSLNSFNNMISPWLKFVGPILLFLAFVGIYLAYDFRLIYLLFLAALIWLLSKLFKKTFNFGQSYKIGLHAISLGLIVELVGNLTTRWIHFDGFPFMVTFISLGVVLVNLFITKKD